METAKIRPLTELDPLRFHELASGYPSMEKFVVTKTESSHETVIKITNQTLNEPYIKKWEANPELEAHYQEVLQEGLSLGLYSLDKLIGISIAERRAKNRSLWVWKFHIDSAFQGQGHGRRLMNALAELGTKASCRCVVSETQNTNAPAIHFYRRVGFQIDAVDLSYYTNQDQTDFEVAIFMKRKLDP